MTEWFMGKSFDCLQRILAVIPAKGSSRRLPRKNMCHLWGKPMLSWTIEGAVNANKHWPGCFLDIVVSTEDAEIAALAGKYPVRVLDRPADLALPGVGMARVAAHALYVLAQDPRQYDAVCVLPPSCPLRSDIRIAQCVCDYQDHPGVPVMAVTKYNCQPWQAMVLDEEDGHLLPTQDYAVYSKTAEEMPELWGDAGAIYIVPVPLLTRENSLWHNPMRGFPLHPWEAVDVDDQESLMLAEMLLGARSR